MSLPRFSITGTYDLKKTLSYLGITKIFQEHGDLIRIVPNRSLKVGEVSLPGLVIAPWGTGPHPSLSPHPSRRTSQNTTHGQAGFDSSPAPPAKCSRGVGTRPSLMLSGCEMSTHSRCCSGNRFSATNTCSRPRTLMRP